MWPESQNRVLFNHFLYYTVFYYLSYSVLSDLVPRQVY